MKKVCILGWYGTETIGDRAIFAGILSLLKKSLGIFEVNLGSLYPTYSERTLLEDEKLYQDVLGYKIKINLFDSKNKKELIKYIKDSDYIFMGGGPIMHISPLYMIHYAFKYAKKLDKKTGLLGCGIGPIFFNKYKKLSLKIINNSDLIILRDNKSKDNILNIAKEFRFNLKTNIKVGVDPAIELILEYMKSKGKSESRSNDYIAVNLREFPSEYSKINIKNKIDAIVENFIKDLSRKFFEIPIFLIPMHYYFIGNDDREFLNKIKFNLTEAKNVYIQNKILTLEETLEIFKNAYFNIGMRFHSVVFQTIISGKNYILDYTEPKKGKISGFIEDIDKNNFYQNRYYNLQEKIDKKINVDRFITNENSKFNLDYSLIKDKLKQYVIELNKLEGRD